MKHKKIIKELSKIPLQERMYFESLVIKYFSGKLIKINKLNDILKRYKIKSSLIDFKDYFLRNVKDKNKFLKEV